MPGFLAGLVVGFAASALILYIGRNYLDESQVSRTRGGEDEVVKFQFYDELEQTDSGKEAVAELPVAESQEPVTEADVVAAGNVEPPTEEPMTEPVVEVVDEPASTSEAETSTTQPLASDSSVADANLIFLQVGFFSEQERAQKLRATLLLEGFEVNTIERKTQNGSGTRFRVLVGPYANKSESDTAIANLRELELTPFVYK